MKFTFKNKIYISLTLCFALLLVLSVTAFNSPDRLLFYGILAALAVLIYVTVLLLQYTKKQSAILQFIPATASTEATDFPERVLSFLELKAAEQKAAAEVIQNIANGNLTFESEYFNAGNALYAPLMLLTHKLAEASVKEKQHAWAVEGEAKFAKILRENLDRDINETAHTFLSHLVKYTGCNQGSIYIVKNDSAASAENKYIEMIATYAFDRKKHLHKRLEWREGLVGQCIFENDIIYITDVPNDYVQITSGLGMANPRCIVIVPVFHNDVEIGAIELISFKVLTENELQFLKKISENFGSAVSNILNTLHTRKLLEESEAASAHLRDQESRLLQNEEELREAQELLNNKLVELQAESNLTQCIVNAINKSNASVEFDMYGNVLTANQMFLSVMGYRLEDILGRHESFMLPDDDMDSEKYTMTWNSLKEGNFISGEFIRKSATGKELWLEATYNPIVDLEGKPYKIIMFASFTNELKEKENETRNKQALYNEAGGFLELDINMNVIIANSYFMNTTQYKRKDIKNLTWNALTDNERQKNEGTPLPARFDDTGAFKGMVFINDAGQKPLKFELTLLPKKDFKNNVTGYNLFLHPTLQ